MHRHVTSKLIRSSPRPRPSKEHLRAPQLRQLLSDCVVAASTPAVHHYQRSPSRRSGVGHEPVAGRHPAAVPTSAIDPVRGQLGVGVVPAKARRG